jgi:hypothetical protein
MMKAPQAIPVFVYGTLMNPLVVQTLLGRHWSFEEENAIQPAILKEHCRYPVIKHVFPAVIPSSAVPPDACSSMKQSVQGILLPATLSDLELSLFDWFESDEYVRSLVQVTAEDGGVVDAQAYIWRKDLISQLDLSREWSYRNFCENSLDWYLKHTVEPCRQEMERLGMTIS